MSEQLWKALDKLRGAQLSEPAEIAQFLEREGVRFTRGDLAAWGQFFAARYGRAGGTLYLPEWLGEVFAALVAEASPETICDPWAGIGFLVGILLEACQPRAAFAFTRSEAEY